MSLKGFSTKNWDREVEKTKRHFRLVFSVFVLVLAFVYGLASGLRNRTQEVQASSFSLEAQAAPSEEINLALHLVPSVQAFPIGEQTAINGNSSILAAFVTNVPVRTLLTEQTNLWERQGLFTLGVTTNKRGAVLASNRNTGEKYAMTAWSSPSPLAESLPPGFLVQGTIALMHEHGAEDSQGIVPGVPLRPGGRAGAIFSSLDRGAKSYTGVYTNPEGLAVNVAFYQDYLLKDGWRLSSLNKQVSHWGAILSFEKQGEEILLVFTEKLLPDSHKRDKSTTIVVTNRLGQGMV